MRCRAQHEYAQLKSGYFGQISRHKHPGCVEPQGHSRIIIGRVNVEQGSLHVSLCTSASPSQLKNNTLHTLYSLAAVHCEAHTAGHHLMQQGGHHSHQEMDRRRIVPFISHRCNGRFISKALSTSTLHRNIIASCVLHSWAYLITKPVVWI